MSRIFMPELPSEERINVLRNNADKIEQTTYEKELTEEELIAKREQFVDNSIAVSKLEDELSEKKKEFKSKIDPLKLINRSLQYEVKTKKSEVKGTLFHMANHDSGYMETYDEAGELVSSRRLRPDEKQIRMTVISQRAANGE